MAFEELKQKQSAMWDSGPFERVAAHIADIHDDLVERLEPLSGTSFLDVACGTGGVAERAAARHPVLSSHVGLDRPPNRPRR